MTVQTPVSAKNHKPKRNRTPKTTPSGVTYIGFVLDRSGSMEVVREATISGFNEYLQDRQREQDIDYRFSLTTFNEQMQRPYRLAKVADVQPLTRTSYVPSGTTALYDAIANTITDIEQAIGPDDRVLFVIMTDGMENSSRENTLAQIHQRIREKEDSGRWTFVYLGANQDSWQVGRSLGMSSQANTLNYAHSTAGMSTAMSHLSHATSTYARSAVGSSYSFFSPDQQSQQADSGAVPVNPASVPDNDADDDSQQKNNQSAVRRWVQ